MAFHRIAEDMATPGGDGKGTYFELFIKTISKCFEFKNP